MKKAVKQTHKAPAKQASLDRLVAAMDMPADTPKEALAASRARIEELSLHQKGFYESLHLAIAEGDCDTIFQLKTAIGTAAAMIEAYRVDVLIASSFVRKFEAQRKEIERLEKALSSEDPEICLDAVNEVLDKAFPSTVQ
jgi:hypothetical protein